MTKFIERFFAGFLFFGLALALLFPEPGLATQYLMPPILMAILTITFVNVRLRDVIANFRQPGFILYAGFVFMIGIPLLLYVAAKPFGEGIALGFLLLAAAPPGVSSSAFTELFGGNTTLSLTITLVFYLIAPFTIPGLIFLVSGESIAFPYVEMVKMVALIIVFPILLSQLLKRFIPKAITGFRPYGRSSTILLVTGLSYIALTPQRDILFNQPVVAIKYLIVLTVVFGLFFVIGYWMAFWRPKADRIALSTSKVFMNNVLAMVLAASFFKGDASLIVILSIIPWTLLPGVVNILTRRLK